MKYGGFRIFIQSQFAQLSFPLKIRNGIVYVTLPRDFDSIIICCLIKFISGTNGVEPYNILILFFSLAYMAITLDISGVLQSAAFWVSNKGGSNGRKLFLYFYLLLTVISVVLGNDPVILTGTVFLVYYTRVNEVSKSRLYLELLYLHSDS